MTRTHVSDPLGTVFYKRGIYQRAFYLLRENAARLPEVSKSTTTS